ncbi:hypothetical protein EsH8_IX_000605 [Colletotrichum jinshuiense]
MYGYLPFSVFQHSIRLPAGENVHSVVGTSSLPVARSVPPMLVTAFATATAFLPTREVLVNLRSAGNDDGKLPSVLILPLYNGQVFHYQTALKGMVDSKEISDYDYQRVEIRTLDSSQGVERDIVFVDFVRIDANGFCRDPRRMNLALTRSKLFDVVFMNEGVNVRVIRSNSAQTRRFAISAKKKATPSASALTGPAMTMAWWATHTSNARRKASTVPIYIRWVSKQVVLAVEASMAAPVASGASASTADNTADEGAASHAPESSTSFTRDTQSFVLGASNTQPTRDKYLPPIKRKHDQYEFFGLPESQFKHSSDWNKGSNAGKGSRYNFNFVDIRDDKPWIRDCRPRWHNDDWSVASHED